MSDEIYITEMSGKTVMDSNGAQIGNVSDVRVDKSGKLREVLVVESRRSEESTNTYLSYPKENGLFKIPISDIQAVKDHILVE